MRVAILPSGALRADRAPGDDEASDCLSVAARTRVTRTGAPVFEGEFLAVVPDQHILDW